MDKTLNPIPAPAEPACPQTSDAALPTTLSSSAISKRRFALSPELQALRSEILGRYPTLEDYLRGVNPTFQLWAVEHPGRAIFYEGSPSLHMLNVIYGDMASKAWLAVQFADLANFCNSRTLMTPARLADLSAVVVANYGYLRCSEFLLFLGWFKGGRYGHTYGSLNALRLTSAIAEYVSERGTLMSCYEGEERRRRERMQPKPASNLMTRDEWEQTEEYKKLWGIDH